MTPQLTTKTTFQDTGTHTQQDLSGDQQAGSPTQESSSREYWRGVLSAGGSTTVPRWTVSPEQGVAVHEEPLRSDLTSAARAVGLPEGVAASAVLLAAHAKVLSVLTGETQVVAGYRTSTGAVLPCVLDTDAATWAGLVQSAAHAESAVLSHQGVDLDRLAGELGVAGPVFETVFDPSGPSAGQDAAGLEGVPDGVISALSVAALGEGGAGVRLAYRTEVWDAGMAVRVAGYHQAALDALTADTQAEHAGVCLVTRAERELQINGMSGPVRPVPDARFHELFEALAAADPGRVAASHAGQVLSYREVNERANQVAYALLDGGLTPQDVVAVVTERNLGWLIALLGIFKAGGAYLPIEPHFPADRIATTLSRAECRVVLTEPASRARLDEALHALPQGVRVTPLEAVLAQGYPVRNPEVPVGADQLAYIYFTSGSTGLPKGAMCEHAGMLNHLFAKIDDLGITADSVIAQTAPQCFDISLWQLIAALAVGGSTLIVEQDAIVDVARFVQTLQTGRVTVAQLVPSYLDVVVSYLRSEPQALPDLARVSATGEALKLDLVHRWFATLPGVPLVNAYGLTETSDDTNHEVMHTPPAGGRVPLGPPANNVTLYLTDEHLQPVPLGAPGAIAFSGVCVGRGYINDPQRSAAAYLPDPHHPGDRLYLAGDYGRWGPDGKLYFLGRRDHQVKINGFRIEIGEIDNALLRMPGIRDGAVLTAPTPDGGQHLVGFYTAEESLDPAAIRAHLSQTLPGYMVPRHLHWQSSLPLTPNGKIDTKALTTLAGELAAPETESQAVAGSSNGHGPATPTEERLVIAWARILGLSADQIQRTDNFYDLGGSSLLAVKLVIAVNRVITLKDLTAHPRLAELATLIDTRDSAPAKATAEGVAPQLLQRVREPDGPDSPVLVCLPYAGGNAVNYVPLARALDASGWGVFAAELPGHDPAAPADSFAALDSVVQTITDEVRRQGFGSVMLYGHSLGTAAALAVAQRLEAAGTPARRVFLGAQLLGSANRRRNSMAEVSTRSNAEITASLSGSGGHPGMADLDAARAEHVGAAFRHDHTTTQTHLVNLLEHPPAARLRTPVTVVVAADDPSTSGYQDRYREWELLAMHVDLLELPDGGHYFLRTRADQAADLLRRAASASHSGADSSAG